MAYGSTPGGNNPTPQSDPPMNAQKTGARANPRPMPMRAPNNMNRMMLFGGLGLMGLFVAFKWKAVFSKSEQAKKLSASGFKDAEGKDNKNYSVSVERSGGGV